MKRKAFGLPIFSLLLTIFITCINQYTNAQDTVLTASYLGRLDSVNSSMLQQKRYIQVFTPTGYKPGSADKYEVIYVLDGGNWNTGLITRIQRFIEDQGHMLPAIIVSVMGIDRNLELTPTQSDSWDGPTGGAAKFLAYLKNELIPHINSHYPSNGDNTIWGHSLGGMFITYALLNEPQTFKSYIAIDPSYWWDNKYIPKQAVSKLPSLVVDHTSLFICGRQGDTESMGIDSMENVLKEKAPAGLTWKIVVYPDETHSSVRFKGSYDGIKFTYANIPGELEFAPTNGIVLKDKPIVLHYYGDTTRMHYTIDGSLPTESSPQVQPKVYISGDARVTYKRFNNRSRYEKTTTGEFKSGEVLKPVAKPKNAVPGGFNYSYYEGDSAQLQHYSTLKPLQTGRFDTSFRIKNLPRKNDYAFIINGFLEAKQDGYYTFYFKPEKGAKLYLGNKLLLQWQDNSKREIYSFIIPLAKGFYSLRIEQFAKKNKMVYPPYYIAPDSARQDDPYPVPVDVQYGVNIK